MRAQVVSAALAAVFLAGCGGGDATGPAGIATISMSMAGSTIAVAEQRQIAAVFRDANGAAKTDVAHVAWTSSDEAIATVDGAGKVTGRALGQATITAAVDDASATLVVTVRPDHIRLTPNVSALGVGEVVRLQATAVDFTGADIPGVTGTPSWTNSNAAAAALNVATGDFAGVAPGTTSVGVTLAGVTSTQNVEVGVRSADDGVWIATMPGPSRLATFEFTILFGSVRKFAATLRVTLPCEKTAATQLSLNAPIGASGFTFSVPELSATVNGQVNGNQMLGSNSAFNFAGQTCGPNGTGGIAFLTIGAGTFTAVRG
jgi:hypothetical protein